MLLTVSDNRFQWGGTNIGTAQGAAVYTTQGANDTLPGATVYLWFSKSADGQEESYYQELLTQAKGAMSKGVALRILRYESNVSEIGPR